MQFLADHCVPRSIGDTLESEGHEAIRLSSRLRVDAEDAAFIEEAKSGAIRLSLNGDFADLLRYSPEEYGGIVALQVRNRPEGIPPSRPVSQSGAGTGPASIRAAEENGRVNSDLRRDGARSKDPSALAGGASIALS